MNYRILGFIILLVGGFLPYVIAGIYGFELFDNHKVIAIGYFLFVVFVLPFILEPMIFHDRNPFKKEF